MPLLNQLWMALTYVVAPPAPTAKRFGTVAAVFNIQDSGARTRPPIRGEGGRFRPLCVNKELLDYG